MSEPCLLYTSGIIALFVDAQLRCLARSFGLHIAQSSGILRHRQQLAIQFQHGILSLPVPVALIALSLIHILYKADGFFLELAHLHRLTVDQKRIASRQAQLHEVSLVYHLSLIHI